MRKLGFQEKQKLDLMSLLVRRRQSLRDWVVEHLGGGATYQSLTAMCVSMSWIPPSESVWVAAFPPESKSALVYIESSSPPVSIDPEPVKVDVVSEVDDQLRIRSRKSKKSSDVSSLEEVQTTLDERTKS